MNNHTNKDEFEALFHSHLGTIDIDAFFNITKGDIHLAKDLLILFKDQANNSLKKLSHKTDDEQKMGIAHAIKGASSCIGAENLHNISSLIENNLREKEPIHQNIENKFTDLLEDVLQYITIIESRIKKII